MKKVSIVSTALVKILIIIVDKLCQYVVCAVLWKKDFMIV